MESENDPRVVASSGDQKTSSHSLHNAFQFLHDRNKLLIINSHRPTVHGVDGMLADAYLYMYTGTLCF